jgi:sulfide:quinone oxidoreductase
MSAESAHADSGTTSAGETASSNGGSAGVDKSRVLIIGGGVAALETALALYELAPDLTDVSVIAPEEQFVYRPMAVREPFSYGSAQRYPLAPIVHDAGATLIADELTSVDPDRRTIDTRSGARLEYDALVLALGAKAQACYEHAVTIDDRRLDEALHGIIQDIEGGYVHSIAFVAPGRMAWPMPLYELALMTAGRAYDMNIELAVTLVTPEDSPLAIFGGAASAVVAELLGRSHIHSINSAYAQVPRAGELEISPGDRCLRVDRVIALPGLYGPDLRGVPLSEHGFLRVNRHCRVVGVERVYAAGDATEFPVKHGGLAAQQADVAAESIAALAGAKLEPQPFTPIIRGILLTGEQPRYLTARITGGHGFSSQIAETPSWDPPTKIAAKYLAPYLDARDRESAPA